MTTRDQLDRASKRHPFGEFSIDAAARDEIDQLQAEVALLRDGILDMIDRVTAFLDSEGNRDDIEALIEATDIARAALSKGGTDE